MRSSLMRLGAIVCAVGWVLHAHGTAGRSPQPPASSAADDWQTPHPSAGSIDIPSSGTAGHYFVYGDVIGRSLRFIVDTGASTVLLNRADAQAVGVDMAHLVFDQQAMTANGPVQIASVTLPALRIGDIQLLDVSADVMNRNDGMPLLGQSFLGRIDKVSIEGGTMRLTKL